MALPTFLVIGAAKGGTTSLHHYLRQHPDVFMPNVKEANYYSEEVREEGRRTARTLAEYARLFDGADGERAVGEISPRYLNSPTAAARIRRDLPAVRLVVSLRNPADRAWSDYLGRVRILRESRPFEAAIEPGEPCLEWGFYHERLKRYYDAFPREQIHVMLYEDFAADPAASMRRLCAFLGIDPHAAIDTGTVHNPAALPRSRSLNHVLWRAVSIAGRAAPPRLRGSGRAARMLARTYRPAPAFPPDLRDRLRETYRDDVAATAKLIARDLSHW